MKAMAIMSNPKTMGSFVKSGEVSNMLYYFFGCEFTWVRKYNNLSGGL